MSEKMSVREFFARFPNDDVCLGHIMEVRYGLRPGRSHESVGDKLGDC